MLKIALNLQTKKKTYTQYYLNILNPWKQNHPHILPKTHFYIRVGVYGGKGSKNEL